MFRKECNKMDNQSFLQGYLFEKYALANKVMSTMKPLNTNVKGMNVPYSKIKPKQSTPPEGPAVQTNRDYQAPLGKV